MTRAIIIARRTLLWLLLVIGVGYGLLWYFQRSLLYPARHYAEKEFRRQVERQLGAKAELLPRFDALLFEPPPAAGAVASTAIWFHGNGDVNLDLAFVAPVFAARGIRLVLAEYPGYGARAGEPSQQLLVDDALALVVEVRRRWPGSALVLVGQSLGSGVAMQAAAALQGPAAPIRVALITPYLSVAET
ncbi:MAG: lysophospholipase, partial [Pseudomonadota bacterium]|nr:lysophospholipase [Pseudomonadota bacterium]